MTNFGNKHQEQHVLHVLTDAIVEGMRRHGTKRDHIAQAFLDVRGTLADLCDLVVARAVEEIRKGAR